jgi:hypothetical protein
LSNKLDKIYCYFIFMTTCTEIASRVEGWLHGEHQYQFGKFDAMYGDELILRRDFIANSEIPNKWNRNIVLRSGGAVQLATQQLLKVCAATRAVVVYDACIAGGDRNNASDGTFNDLHQYFAGLTEKNLPEKGTLRQAFDIAFPDTESAARFRRAGLLAVVGVSELESVVGVIELPRPGLPSGQLE